MAYAKKKYPKRLQIPTTREIWDRIERESEVSGLSIAEVARTYLQAGMEAADEAAV